MQVEQNLVLINGVRADGFLHPQPKTYTASDNGQTNNATNEIHRLATLTGY